MALFFDTEVADEAADDALQVVDLGDIVIDSIEGVPAPAHLGKRRRVTVWGVLRLVLVFGLGMALSVPIVAAVRLVRGDGDGSQVDIQDRHRDLPDLQPPTTDPEQPPQDVDRTPPAPADDTATDPEADPGGKAAFKQATAGAPVPAGAPADTTGSTVVPPATTSTAPTTTVPSTTTTPSATLPDGSPNPLGPGPDGPQSGPTTTMPDPYGSDLIPGG